MIVKTKNLKKHEKIRILSIVISTYVHSVNVPPKRMNGIFLRWTEDAAIPTKDEMKYLISKIDPSYF